MDAQSTRRLYEQLLVAHPNTPRIDVMCYNARYYKNQKLTAWLADKLIQQVFLSPYSPNLNLIERLWKFLRQKHLLPDQGGVQNCHPALLRPTP